LTGAVPDADLALPARLPVTLTRAVLVAIGASLALADCTEAPVPVYGDTNFWCEQGGCAPGYLCTPVPGTGHSECRLDPDAAVHPLPDAGRDASGDGADGGGDP
jgi:hypothetical protein